MKKIILFVLLSLTICWQASAHGGGIDGYGGHHNRKQGGYHFHRGPLAGQNFSSKEEAIAALKNLGKENKNTNVNKENTEEKPRRGR